MNIRNLSKFFFFLILLLIPLLTWASLININTASLEELDKIPEVGPVIAGRIIDYRNTNGPFENIEEIKNVSGIGDVTFLKMKDYITVGNGAGSGNDSDEADEETETDEDDDSSVHTGDAGLSNYTAEESFKISAGRERLATVRTPIIFLASQNKGKSKREAKFVWSFGDGTKAIGTEVHHTYQFPGNYQVVLNGSLGKEEQAVARTTVLVTESKVKISDIDLAAGYVELTNTGDKEQNLSGWSLIAGEKRHVFPLDTIIGSRSAIKIPLGATSLAGVNINEIALTYPDGNKASSRGTVESDLEKITALEERLQNLKQQLAVLKTNGKTASVIAAAKDKGNLSEAKKVVVLAKEPSLIEKIKNVLFK